MNERKKERKNTSSSRARSANEDIGDLRVFTRALATRALSAGDRSFFEFLR